ncbi:MAG: hypothetical protein J7521_07995 [Caulobacter sp.]|nr:hypothetical protein [Caulobacter sp.]
MRSWRLPIIVLALAATAACDGGKAPAGQGKATKPPAAAPSPPASRPAAELVSIAWKPSSHDQNLQAFDLEVTGLDVLSVCRVPSGWTIDATGAGLGVTRLQGQAEVGAAFVSDDDLEDIADLFLVRARPGQPLSVRGTLTTGTYGGDEGQAQVRATTSVLARKPGAACPPPRR